jgi:hypothetical protein
MLSEFWCSHGDESQDDCLMGCAVYNETRVFLHRRKVGLKYFVGLWHVCCIHNTPIPLFTWMCFKLLNHRTLCSLVPPNCVVSSQSWGLVKPVSFNSLFRSRACSLKPSPCSLLLPAVPCLLIFHFHPPLWPLSLPSITLSTFRWTSPRPLFRLPAPSWWSWCSARTLQTQMQSWISSFAVYLWYCWFKPKSLWNQVFQVYVLWHESASFWKLAIFRFEHVDTCCKCRHTYLYLAVFYGCSIIISGGTITFFALKMTFR